MIFKPLAVIQIVMFTLLAARVGADELKTDTPEETIKAWVAAFNDNDPERLLEFYHASDEVEIVVSAGLRHRGFKAIQKAYRDDQGSFETFDSTAEKISTQTYGETALVTFEHKFIINVLEDDSRWQVHIRTSTVLISVQDQWKIVHEHSSPIFGVERMSLIED